MKYLKYNYKIEIKDGIACLILNINHDTDECVIRSKSPCFSKKCFCKVCKQFNDTSCYQWMWEFVYNKPDTLNTEYYSKIYFCSDFEFTLDMII
jgi:hypothetical protein